MKKLYLIVILIFITSNIIAQEFTDKGYIAFSVGPSFPLGDYASVDENNEKAGLAATGAIFDLSFAHRLGKNFGIAAILRSMSNPVDVNQILDRHYSPTGLTYSVEADSWSHIGIMIGAFCSFPIQNSPTVFETRLLFGAMSAKVPQISISTSTTSSEISESKSAGCLAFLIGGNFRFMADKKISILTGLDFYKCSVEFPNVKTTHPDGSTHKDTFTQSVSTINLSIGIAYRLGTKVPQK